MPDLQPVKPGATSGEIQIAAVMDDSGLCRSCRRAPPALYVCRHGVYLPNLCYRCWKKGDPDAGNKRN
jgi:hypothetical protein